MRPNFKTGFQRLIIVVVSLWVAVWVTVVALDLIRANSEWQGMRSCNASAETDQSALVREIARNCAIASVIRAQNSERLAKVHGVVGLGGIAAGALAVGLSFWVWRGFTPRRISN